MSTFPATLDDFATGSSSPTLASAGLATLLNELEKKVGIDSSTVATSHDYKLSGVASGDKAVSLTGMETLTNKTLTSPKINEDVAVTATATELNYVDGVTSAIQTQIDTKAPLVSPTFTTPTLGAATATSINKVTITAPTTSATLTLVTGSSLITAGAYALTLTSTATTNATMPAGTVTLVGTASTDTLTNKRITKRVGTVASSATPTPDSDSYDLYTVTALAEAATFGAPTGTPTNGQTLVIRILDNGTARALDFNASYRFSTDLPKPTTTVLGKTLYMGFMYNTADSKWDCLAILNNF